MYCYAGLSPDASIGGDCIEIGVHITVGDGLNVSGSKIGQDVFLQFLTIIDVESF